MRVRLISRRGQSALVEWFDGQRSHRSYVPAESLARRAGARYESAEHECAAPELGIPHGLPWAELFRLTATPDTVEAELHRHGIWTAADLELRPRDAAHALATLFAADLAHLRQAARAYLIELDRHKESDNGN